MAIESPAEELRLLKSIEGQTADLRTQWDYDFGLYRLDEDKYLIPEEEGEFDQVISNRCQSENNKVMEYLAHARRKLWIVVFDEASKGRRSLSLTERLAIGCIDSADQLNADAPEAVENQAQLAF